MKNAMQLKAVMKKIAKEKKISAQLVLQNYMLERFLERISVSRFSDKFILKGGFLIASMVGLDSRATMDMDATMKGYPVTEETIQRMIEEVVAIPIEDDVTFTMPCGYSLSQCRGAEERSPLPDSGCSDPVR
ncbi:MAG: nucleotidyl transferase AbiEii/AbiGii toxin family protein [Oscillospiraceae bacterium]|nr:nucleotidyl transferase AbiEii/AbiGii toxin family protein [Oscillospiraceae bacterium]